MAVSFETTDRLLSFDKTPLFWRCHLPKEKANAHVIVSHGFSEHGGRYAHLAEFLGGRGYGVWAMDNRGHGRSAGKRGHVDRYDDYVRDMECFYKHVVKESGVERPFLVGHSNGGLISLRFALANPGKLRGLVLSNPLLRLAMPVSGPKLLAGKILVKISNTFTLPNGINPEDLTRDPAMIEAYLADPLIFHQVTVGWFDEMEKAAENARKQGRLLKNPLLMLIGTADPVCDPAAAEEFYETVAAEDKEIRRYTGLLHEIFNEVERRQVFEDLADWLDRHVAAGSNGEA